MTQVVKLTVTCGALLAALATHGAAAPVSPICDTFGPFPAATFGGGGIPNHAVAITQFDFGGNTITLGLTAHQRYVGPNLANNGAGTFFAPAGGFSGGGGHPADPTLAQWNFGTYINTTGADFDDLVFEFLYDFDPGAGTDESNHGVITIPGSSLTSTTAQASENLGFGFLATASPGIVPPALSSFDPNAIGEYTFSLRAYDLSMNPLGEAAILVSTVPEPISASLFGIGAVGMVVGGIRRRRKAQAE